MKIKYVKPTIEISRDNSDLLQAAESNIAVDKKHKNLRPSDEKVVFINSKIK